MDAKETNFELEIERIRTASDRFHLISPLLEPHLVDSDRIALQKKIAEENGVSYRTLARYVKLYREGGFDALKPSYGEGRPPAAITETVLNEAIMLRREQPGRSVEDIIRILELENFVEKGSIKRSTLDRALSFAGWSKKQMRMYIQPAGGKCATRYQKIRRMDLLQTDIKYGPSIMDGDGNSVKTYFICFIDDCTRMVLFGRFYASQTENEVLEALKCVIESYGIPVAIATDNGKQFVSQHVLAAMAVLGIRHRRCKPFNAAAKGYVKSYVM